MPQQPVPGYLAYRVLDQNSGAVIVANLPHPHQSSWTVRALQQGFPGSTSLGDFKIPLFAPRSDEFARASASYNALAIGQRVEAFAGDVVTGVPRFSGVITKMHQPLAGGWEISGSDSLWWLQQSQLLPGEVISAPVTGLSLVQSFSGTQEVVWDDDFAGWNDVGPAGRHRSVDYTTSGFSFTASDPYFAQPALTSTSINPTIARVVTTSTWLVGSQYSPCSISIHGTMAAGTDTGSESAEAGVLLLCDSTAQNGLLARAVMLQTGVGTGLYNVTADIYTISGGTYTRVAGPASCFTSTKAIFPFEVTAVVYASGSTTNVRVLVNGKDSGIVYSTASPPASGGIGLRWSPASGGSPAIYVNRIQFHSRTGTWGTNRFATGTQVAGTLSVQQPITSSSQSHLDMLLLASSLDGFWLRKNPGFGHKADSLDYGATPGADLSASVTFEEGVNVIDAETATVAELYATEAKLQGVPGGDSGGSVTWGRIGAGGDMVLTDTVTDLGVPGFLMLAGYAKAIQARKATPLQATQIKVARLSDTVDRWRELDYAMVHLPTLGIRQQKTLIVGYTFAEGVTEQTVWLTQLPASAFVAAQIGRITRPLEYLATTYQPR